MNHFKGKQFKKDVIIVAVGYYLRYNLSYREVQELLYDRGINVCHTTIYRWVQEYSKVLYYLWKKKNRQSFYSWKMDETYIKIKGRWHYLYRAIDADGLTLDIWLRKKRDTQAAYAFLKRLVKQFDEPKVVVTDKAPSITSAFKKLKEYGFYQGTEHRTIKYLNNLIEQDHRPVKRRNKFYRRNQGIIGNPSLNHRYRKGFYSLFKTLQQNLLRVTVITCKYIISWYNVFTK
ncbi:Integrase core domain protein [Enterococcus faecium]|nr:Integrase core domain protein [Enterococcus faecium]